MCKKPYFLFVFLHLMFKNLWFLYGFLDLEEASNLSLDVARSPDKCGHEFWHVATTPDMPQCKRMWESQWFYVVFIWFYKFFIWLYMIFTWFYIVFIWFYMVFIWFYMVFYMTLYDSIWFFEVWPKSSDDPFFWILNVPPEIRTFDRKFGGSWRTHVEKRQHGRCKQYSLFFIRFFDNQI